MYGSRYGIDAVLQLVLVYCLGRPPVTVVVADAVTITAVVEEANKRRPA